MDGKLLLQLCKIYTYRTGVVGKRHERCIQSPSTEEISQLNCTDRLDLKIYGLCAPITSGPQEDSFSLFLCPNSSLLFFPPLSARVCLFFWEAPSSLSRPWQCAIPHFSSHQVRTFEGTSPTVDLPNENWKWGPSDGLFFFFSPSVVSQKDH